VTFHAPAFATVPLIHSFHSAEWGIFRLASKDRGQMLWWIQNAKQCGLGALVRFAFGLQKDLSAVLAAVETPWSNGQVEGQINRLKTIKRQMYGRAGFRLLRARVLPFIPLRPLAAQRAP
jgi:transposase